MLPRSTKRRACALWVAGLAFVCLPAFAQEQSGSPGNGGSGNDNAVNNNSVNNNPVKDKWAVVVGVSQFKDKSINLKYPAKDAIDFSRFLTTEGHFAPDHVKVLVNEQATREQILDVIGDKWLPRLAHPDDLVVIFISTHGSPSNMDIGGVNYLIAYDTDKERLYSTGLAMQDLCRIIKDRVHSDRTLLVLDACHSGATSPDGKGIVRKSNVDAGEIAQGTGQMVICSSAPDQVSWESKQSANSVFTRRLIESFKSKGDKTSVTDAFNYLKEQVEDEVLRDRGQMQTPVLKTRWQGDGLLLSAKPVSPRPGFKEAPVAVPVDRAPAAVVVEKSPPAVATTVKASVPPPAVAPQLSGAEALSALRQHFVKMALGQSKSAYDDFTETIKKINPFERYQINLRRQKYLPAVANLPAQDFRVGSVTASSAQIFFNEKNMTGIPMYWRYTLVARGNRWLIDSYKVVDAKTFSGR
ncbi:MAG: caspase family protein [Candidatus Obscuribacter sp.]|nr:caspase family protein [Candidatus Obscuribacter sp.]